MFAGVDTATVCTASHKEVDGGGGWEMHCAQNFDSCVWSGFGNKNTFWFWLTINKINRSCGVQCHIFLCCYVL